MISVIIIVKNDRRISGVLEELKSMRKPDKTEIIVVDASMGRLDDIRKQFPYIHWINFINKKKKKITIPEQRNIGIKYGKGEIIVFIDSDCKPEKNWLYELVIPIREESEDIVAGFVKIEDKHSLHNLTQKSLDKKYIDECPTMNVAIQKDVFQTVGLYDETFQFGSDMDFCWRARKAGFNIRVNNKAIIHHDLGGIKHEIRRMYYYGKARIRLYRKHRYRWKFFIHELSILFYPLYFIFLPITFIYIFYPLLLLFPIIKYHNKSPYKMILMKTIYGTGFSIALISP